MYFLSCSHANNLHTRSNFFSSSSDHYWRGNGWSTDSGHPTANSGGHHSCSGDEQEEGSSSELPAGSSCKVSSQ